jgi:hypothetical protein
MEGDNYQKYVNNFASQHLNTLGMVMLECFRVLGKKCVEQFITFIIIASFYEEYQKVPNTNH